MANAFITLRTLYIKPFILKYGAIGEGSWIRTPALIDGSQNIFLGKYVNIKGGCTILTVGSGRLIMKDYSGAAVGLTAVASNHKRAIGIRERTNDDNVYRDIIVEEEVSIGAHCTLLAGAHIGRGAIIGAGAVIRGEVPPYAVVIGNPAKVIGFRYSPEDCIKHESLIYPVAERISAEILEANYERFYLSKKDEIMRFKNISL